jgi:geranylgeranyl diphosphate synthase, type I
LLIESQIQQFKTDYDLILSKFLDGLKPALPAGPQPFELAYNLIREFTSQGGKRLRPFLVETVYKGYGGNKISEIRRAACAFELMHTHLLIHDDIIDQSALRRGNPTVHEKYKLHYSQSENTGLEHLALSLALLTGNLAANFGLEAIVTSCFEQERVLKAVDLFNQVLRDENYGQILDLQAQTGYSVSEAEILTIFYYKTTRYTVEGPVCLGALLAGASDSEIAVLKNISRPLGNIFQLQDDILGLFGDEAVIGKPIDSDVKEGKQTILIEQTLKRASASYKKVVLQALGNPKLTVKEFQTVREIVKASGALEYSRRLIEGWVKESSRILADCALSQESKMTLREFTEYLAVRKN